MELSIHAPKSAPRASEKQSESSTPTDPWASFDSAEPWKPDESSKLRVPSISSTSCNLSTASTPLDASPGTPAHYEWTQQLGSSVIFEAPKAIKPMRPTKPSVIRYSSGRLRQIRKTCSKIPLPASSINAMIMYELRCEEKSHSLFWGDEFHCWHDTWQQPVSAPPTQAQTPAKVHAPTQVQTPTVGDEETREMAVRCLQLEMRDKQQALALDRLEDRVAELESQREHVITSKVHNRDVGLQDSATDPDSRKAAFEASVSENLREMPLFSRHRAKVNVVVDGLESMKNTLSNLEKILDALVRQKQGSDEVLPRSVNGFKTTGGLARWALPHVQQLEYGLRELAFGENTISKKENDAPIEGQHVSALPAASNNITGLSAIDDLNVPALEPFSIQEATQSNSLEESIAFNDVDEESDYTLSIPGAWSVYPTVPRA